MALFHLSVTQTKRSAGQSAIASAAYRAVRKKLGAGYACNCSFQQLSETALNVPEGVVLLAAAVDKSAYGILTACYDTRFVRHEKSCRRRCFKLFGL